MKQDKDWTDVMRNALRDAEVTPPADGWARLERELKTPAPGFPYCADIGRGLLPLLLPC